jgi:hypothetical protein
VEKFKAALLDSTIAQRKTVYTRVRHGLKKQMSKDPDMWSWFQQLLLDAFDGMWDDVEDEVEHLLDRGFFKQREEERQPPPDSVPLVARVRAFLLHHYFPGDRSFFGKLKDPVWLVIAACTMLPVHGLRLVFFMVLLLCLVLPGPPGRVPAPELHPGAQGHAVLPRPPPLLVRRVGVLALRDLALARHRALPAAARPRGR